MDGATSQPCLHHWHNKEVTDTFDLLVHKAMSAAEGGWDFGWLTGRAHGSDPTWSYLDLAQTALLEPQTALDVDTGGGEILSSLLPLPSQTFATEAWAPNLARAKERLTPLGVKVVAASGDALPLAASSVDLVLNRHGRLTASETARILRPGAKLLTQQVGSDDCEELNVLLGAPRGHAANSWTLAVVTSQLEAAGLRITDAREEFPAYVLNDIAAVVFQLQKVAWQVPDFSPAAYETSLRALHQRLLLEGPLTIHSHRFLVAAELRSGHS